MAWASPHSQETRAAVAAMLRDTDLTMIEIGRRLGISPGTVSTWNGREGWRRPRSVGRRGLSPADWSDDRLQALARLYYTPANDPGDIAVALGLGRCSARTLFRACGIAKRRDPAARPNAPARPPGEDAPALHDLNAAIRVQIGRQIEAFDAALDGQAAAVIDSARVLRDLGGLKRLLDDLTASAPSPDGAPYGEPADLAGLRDRLARRFAALAPPGGPAGDP